MHSARVASRAAACLRLLCRLPCGLAAPAAARRGPGWAAWHAAAPGRQPWQDTAPAVPAKSAALAAALATSAAAAAAEAPGERPLVVVAFGGNALLKRGEALTMETQMHK